MTLQRRCSGMGTPRTPHVARMDMLASKPREHYALRCHTATCASLRMDIAYSARTRIVQHAAVHSVHVHMHMHARGERRERNPCTCRHNRRAARTRVIQDHSPKMFVRAKRTGSAPEQRECVTCTTARALVSGACAPRAQATLEVKHTSQMMQVTLWLHGSAHARPATRCNTTHLS